MTQKSECKTIKQKNGKTHHYFGYENTSETGTGLYAPVKSTAHMGRILLLLLKS